MNLVLIEEVEEAKFVHSKNKAAYLKHRDIHADLKPRKKRGKCLGAAVLDLPSTLEGQPIAPPISYNVISNDIWFHIADHIRPETVQTFALICRQTANLVRTQRFWRNLYRRFVSIQRILPAELRELPQIGDCDMRARVIASLFYCHTPLKELTYSLDTLLGRTYIASWHQQCQCIWIMCYKFWNQLAAADSNARKISPVASSRIVSNWESLAMTHGVDDSDDDGEDDSSSFSCSKFTNPHEGVSLLIICCTRFMPFPTHLLYGQSGSSTERVCLLATRQMLTQDMRGSNLELDFVNAISKAVTTVRYPNILKCKVLPWWHPDFRKFVK